MKRRHALPLIIALLTTAGFALRIYHLDFQCLTAEETYTTGMMARPFSSILLSAFSIIGTPPGYYLFAHLSYLTFPLASDGWIIRLPSAIFGTLCIPSIYFLGKKYCNEQLGVLAAMSVAFLFSFIYYSQNGRTYMLLLLMVIWTLWFYLDAIEGKNTTAFAVASGLCLWTNFFSIVPVATMWAFLFIRREKFVKESIITSVLCFPFIFYFYGIANYLTTGWGSEIIAAPSPYNIQWHQMVSFVFPELFGNACIFFMALLALSIFLTTYADDIQFIFFVISASTIVSVVVSTLFFGSAPRYAFPAAVPIILLSLRPVAEYLENKTRMQQASVCAGTLFIILAMSCTQYLGWYTVNFCQYYSLLWR